MLTSAIGTVEVALSAEDAVRGLLTTDGRVIEGGDGLQDEEVNFSTCFIN
jgi:hypothetical protein